MSDTLIRCSWCKSLVTGERSKTLFVACNGCTDILSLSKRAMSPEQIVDCLVKAGRIQPIKGDLALEIVKG